MINKESKETKFNTNVIHVFNCHSLTEPQIFFLTKLLFLSKYNQSFNINRSLVEICMKTKLKKNFDNKPTQLLIFYKSPSELDLQTLQTDDFINIISFKDDKQYYEQLDHDIRFNIVGTRTITKLSIPEIAYMNNLISQFKKDNNLISLKQSICNHYKNFNGKVKNHKV